MVNALAYVWRVAATALSFLIFNVGSVCLGLALVPTLWLLVRDPLKRRRLARATIHLAFGAFVRTMQALGVLTYEIHGAQRLARHRLLILANHPSLIDVVFLVALVRRADVVVKSALRRNPFTSGPVRAAGYICNDASLDIIDQCIASVRASNNLIIFPEGTRTPRDGRACLLRGAAYVAVRGQFDITPVRIGCAPPVLGKGEPWYRAARRRPHFTLQVGDDIAIAPFLAASSDDRAAAQALTRFLTGYFTCERSP